VVGEICFIVTLVIHGSGSSSSGSSRGTHTSASIRWIRPSYTYPNESSRVVVYWIKSHNMFECYVDEIVKLYLIACGICWLALAYPFCCMFVLYVAVFPCDDHQLGWWEQLGEVLRVNKRMVIPLLSHLGWSLPCVYLGPWPMYFFPYFYATFYVVSIFNYPAFVGIVVCLVL